VLNTRDEPYFLCSPAVAFEGRRPCLSLLFQIFFAAWRRQHPRQILVMAFIARHLIIQCRSYHLDHGLWRRRAAVLRFSNAAAVGSTSGEGKTFDKMDSAVGASAAQKRHRPRPDALRDPPALLTTQFVSGPAHFPRTRNNANFDSGSRLRFRFAFFRHFCKVFRRLRSECEIWPR